MVIINKFVIHLFDVKCVALGVLAFSLKLQFFKLLTSPFLKEFSLFLGSLINNRKICFGESDNIVGIVEIPLLYYRYQRTTENGVVDAGITRWYLTLCCVFIHLYSYKCTTKYCLSR